MNKQLNSLLPNLIFKMYAIPRKSLPPYLQGVRDTIDLFCDKQQHTQELCNYICNKVDCLIEKGLET